MKDRFRLFQIILYDDSDSYDIHEVFRNLKSYKKWAYIKHDKDLNSDDVSKKLHIHFLLHLENAMTIKALSNKIGVPINYIQNVRNERSCVRYLIHKDDEDKFQYNLSEIKCSGSYERYVNKCFDDLETDEEIIQKIFSFVDSLLVDSRDYSNILFLLIQFINKNCYDTIYKRYRYEINDFIKSQLYN